MSIEIMCRTLCVPRLDSRPQSNCCLPLQGAVLDLQHMQTWRLLTHVHRVQPLHDHAITDVDAHDKAERALEVVRELHKRYKAQDERWHNYLKLIGFIVFAALLLSVIYLQRDAHVLYQVHSTIAAGVLPDPADISSPTDVLDWLKQFLQVLCLLHNTCSSTC